MAEWYKRPTSLMVLAAIILVIVFLAFFNPGGIADPGTVLDTVAIKLSDWVVIVSAVMVYIGVINVIRHAVREARFRVPGRWYFGIFQVFLVAVMFISGFGEAFVGGLQEAVTASGQQTVVNWFNDYYLIPMLQGLAALSGLWVVTASYRAFKARSLEAFIFLFAGALLMLQNAPIGAAIWPGFSTIGDWIIYQIYQPVQFAFLISMGIGIITYIARYFMGREPSAWGAGE